MLNGGGNFPRLSSIPKALFCAKPPPPTQKTTALDVENVQSQDFQARMCQPKMVQPSDTNDTDLFNVGKACGVLQKIPTRSRTNNTNIGVMMGGIGLTRAVSSESASIFGGSQMENDSMVHDEMTAIETILE